MLQRLLIAVISLLLGKILVLNELKKGWYRIKTQSVSDHIDGVE